MKLYVGNLSWGTTDADLQNLFSQKGAVTSATVLKGPDGRSRGFGFVEFANDADAQAAIDAFNGYELDGRKLTVNEARPKTENGGGMGARRFR
jgi:RNA recognition motif-containing protein